MKKLLSYFMVMGFVLTCVIVPTHATNTNPAPVSEKSFDLSDTEIYLGQQDSVDLEVINPVGVDVSTVAWHSTNPAIATVDANGLVQSVSLGDVKIIATIDGIEKECLVHVSKIIHLSLVGVVDGVVIEESRYTSPALLAGQAGFTDEFIESYKKPIDQSTKEESGDTYEFAGMFYDVEGTKPLNTATRFNEDTTIYLVWKEKSAVTPEPEKTNPVQSEETKEKDQKQKKESTKKKKPVQTSDEQSIVMYGALMTMTVAIFMTLKYKKSSRD